MVVRLASNIVVVVIVVVVVPHLTMILISKAIRVQVSGSNNVLVLNVEAVM